jgi:hypothetical protein
MMFSCIYLLKNNTQILTLDKQTNHHLISLNEIAFPTHSLVGIVTWNIFWPQTGTFVTDI